MRQRTSVMDGWYQLPSQLHFKGHGHGSHHPQDWAATAGGWLWGWHQNCVESLDIGSPVPSFTVLFCLMVAFLVLFAE
ncbi:hypothetical protein J0S82_016775 [Galemys pyrenaicus]|uniref:Uncharacterized protein n=1 Tax=Galemys pyrenaicus TaxID=202257 RepID=A0A8J6DVL4_GALPY|nr:hypothetical protein J0S82_016775 [Galemys pyrenaicus]